MDLNAISNITANNYYSNKNSVDSKDKDDTEKKTGFSSEAAVFEKSSNEVDSSVKNQKADRIICQL